MIFYSLRGERLQDTGNSEKQQMRKQRICHCGDNIVQGPPVLIPNTEVKLRSAEDTRLETAWEKRTAPTPREGDSRESRAGV